MSEVTKKTVKVPISKAKFYGYLTEQEQKSGGEPKLLRTVCIASDVRDQELPTLAYFFMEMGEEEVISHILVTKNTLNSITN